MGGLARVVKCARRRPGSVRITPDPGTPPLWCKYKPASSASKMLFARKSGLFRPGEHRAAMKPRTRNLEERKTNDNDNPRWHWHLLALRGAAYRDSQLALHTPDPAAGAAQSQAHSWRGPMDHRSCCTGPLPALQCRGAIGNASPLALHNAMISPLTLHGATGGAMQWRWVTLGVTQC
ncbi:hypothetical protein NDU88_003455 [Pleurodeles waltl]|uniref:Uncharacterized protein n=1 Tax=Pleurodeles waltl TaxID=8319 RepID=A0AAV7SDN6_PLEWA|nr:hypothetical protein NDU88_003455 [Pleurodeles waltl]